MLHRKMANHAIKIALHLPVLGLLVLPCTSAAAHGIQGHIHVTGWAIENLPPGPLRTFFEEPAVMNAALFGAAFTDSGYWPQGGDLAERTRAYTEYTHWEPFVSRFVAWIRDNDPPPWTTLESRQRVAFLLGAAAHGMQDELFDSVFLYQCEHKDGAGQAEADPGTDGFLAQDGHLRFVPERWLPMETLLELYAELNAGVTAEDIDAAVSVMVFVYVNPDGAAVARQLGEQHRAALPWSAAHYLDPAIPGSLRAEIWPTARYLEALWARLHGAWDPDKSLVIHTWPEPPRRLLAASGTPDSWVTLIFGAGVENGSAQGRWTTAAGAPVPFSRQDTRWTGAGWSRLLRLLPDEPLTPGGFYQVALDPGAALRDGGTFGGAFAFDFQVACASADDPLCPDLGDLPAAAIDGSGPPGRDPEAPPEAGPEPAPEAAPEAADAAPDAAGAEPEAEPAPEAPAPTARGASDGCTGAAPGPPPGALAALALLLLLRLRRRRGRPLTARR